MIIFLQRTANLYWLQREEALEVLREGPGECQDVEADDLEEGDYQDCTDWCYTYEGEVHCLWWKANNLLIKSNSLAPLLYTERLKTDWSMRVVTSWNVNTLISRQAQLSSIKYADDVTILMRREWLSYPEPSRQSYVHQLTSSLENTMRVGLSLN